MEYVVFTKAAMDPDAGKVNFGHPEVFRYHTEKDRTLEHRDAMSLCEFAMKHELFEFQGHKMFEIVRSDDQRRNSDGTRRTEV